MKRLQNKLLCISFFLSFMPMFSFGANSPLVDSAITKLFNYNNAHQFFDLEFTINIDMDSSETMVTDTCTFLRYEQYYYSNCDDVIEVMNDSIILQIDSRIKKIRIFPLDTLQPIVQSDNDIGQIIGSISSVDSMDVSSTDSTQTISVHTNYGFYTGMSYTINNEGKILKTEYFMPAENYINTYIYLYNKYDLLTQYRSEFDISTYIQYNGSSYTATSNYADYTVQILSEP